MKDKIKKIVSVVVTVLIVILAILIYPWFVSVEDGETICRNILGKETICMERR